MHPAFSVIFFTTASGAGFGLFFWFGVLGALDKLPDRIACTVLLVLAAVLVVAGLLSSTAHLGKPLRSWRAFSQWRSSWLSREGVLAIACLVTGLGAGVLMLQAPERGAIAGASSALLSNPLAAGAELRIAASVLALLALGSVACTAMIYHSLKPVPAWRHPLVVPVYLAFSLYTGGLVAAAVLALSAELASSIALAAMIGAALVWRLKAHAWRALDSGALPVDRSAALGLPATRTVQVFERPHTEANYLLKEMGYVVARRHARALRTIAAVFFALLPAVLALPVWLLPHVDAFPWMTAAALLALQGVLVERWLFFAEARHLVTLYY